MDRRPHERMRFAYLKHIVGLLAVLGVAGGCAAPNRVIKFCGGGSPPEALVLLESVTATEDSPALGYPFPGLMPFYPFDMQRAGLSGQVLVRVVVGVNGAVERAWVIDSSHREFERTVLDAITRWRFGEVRVYGSTLRRGLIMDCRFVFAIA